MNQLDSFKIASLHATANIVNEQDAKQLTTKFSTAGRTVGAKGKRIKKIKTKGMKSDSSETSSQLLDDDMKSEQDESGIDNPDKSYKKKPTKKTVQPVIKSKAMTTVTPGPMYSNNLRAMIDQNIVIHAGSKMSGYTGTKITTKAKGGRPAHSKQHSTLTAKGYSHVKTVRTSQGPYSIYSHPKEGRLMVSKEGKITNIKAKKD